jgi:hypothetical protein
MKEHVSPACLAAAWVLFAAFGAGCGGRGAASAAGADVSMFLGSWNVVSAMRTITCSNGIAQTLRITRAFNFTAGPRSDLFNTGPVCALDYDLAEHVATAIPGQTCNDPRVITSLHFDEDTFTTTDGISADHHGVGFLSTFIDIIQGGPVSCTWAEDGTYQRVTIGKP